MRPRNLPAILHVVAGIAVFACPALAQNMTIDIPAQDLRTALDEYIKLTNVQLVYRVDDLTGLRSHSVHGVMDINEVLDQLLDGSGIAVHRDPSGAIVVSRQLRRGTEAELPAQSEPPVASVETIMVTGYRASLQQAIDIKRDSVGVRDSIVAEDIGKFPASNIAESLLRVPGVVLVRDTRTDEGR